MKIELYGDSKGLMKTPISTQILDNLTLAIGRDASELLQIGGLQDANADVRGELAVVEGDVAATIARTISAMNTSEPIVISYTEAIPQIVLCRGTCSRNREPSYSYYDRYQEYVTEISQNDNPFELTVTTKSRSDAKDKFDTKIGKMNLRDVAEIDVTENSEYGYFSGRFIGEDSIYVIDGEGNEEWVDSFEFQFSGSAGFSPQMLRDLHANAFKAYTTLPQNKLTINTPSRSYYFVTSSCLNCRPNEDSVHTDYFISDIVFVDQFDYDNLEGAFFDQMRIDYVWAIGARTGRSSLAYESFEDATRERETIIEKRISSAKGNDTKVHRVRIGTEFPHFVYSDKSKSVLNKYFYLFSSCANCNPDPNIGISVFYSDIVYASKFNPNVTSKFFDFVAERYPYGNPVGERSGFSSTYKEAYRLRRETIANWVDQNWREEYGDRVTKAYKVSLSRRKKN